MTEQISNPFSVISKTLVRSDVVDQHRTLVLTCDYTDSGLCGYFVCWERKVSGGYEYSDPTHFQRMVTQHSFKDAMSVLASTIKHHKS